MNISEFSALDHLARSCQAADNSMLSADQLKSILLSATYKVQEESYNTDGLIAFAQTLATQINENVPDINAMAFEKVLSIWKQALAAPNGELFSVNEVEAAIEEVTPYLTPEITETVNHELSTAKTSNNKIVKAVLVKILELIVIPLILSLVTNQMATKEHDHKEEAHWAAMEEYQQSSLSTNQEIIELLKELKNASDVKVDVVDEADHLGQTIIDSVDSGVDIVHPEK